MLDAFDLPGFLSGTVFRTMAEVDPMRFLLASIFRAVSFLRPSLYALSLTIASSFALRDFDITFLRIPRRFFVKAKTLDPEVTNMCEALGVDASLCFGMLIQPYNVMAYSIVSVN